VRRLVAGAGFGGGPHVKVFDAAGNLLASFFAYDPAFRGGVTVAAGDTNGDGVDDIVTGAGLGGGPHVQVFDGNSFALIASFFAYDIAFRGGASVGVADVDGDGLGDIITGAGPGGGPHVKVFTPDGGSVISSFFAYAADFRGGVLVAGGDIEGDGFAEVVTGTGVGGGAHVRVFDGTTGAPLASFFAYDIAFRGGVTVGVGDVNGPHVRAFDGPAALAGIVRPLKDFFAYDINFRGGVFVAASDFDGDGFAEIITGAGPTGGPHVKVFDGESNATLESFFAYDPAFTGGVLVG
jgi:hypothetical protein